MPEFTVTLSDEDAARVTALAALFQKTEQEVIAQAVTEGLDDLETPGRPHNW